MLLAIVADARRQEVSGGLSEELGEHDPATRPGTFAGECPATTSDPRAWPTRDPRRNRVMLEDNRTRLGSHHAGSSPPSPWLASWSSSTNSIVRKSTWKAAAAISTKL
jgi:hypothetical protein